MALLLAGLAGCSLVRYQDGPLHFTRLSLGTDLAISQAMFAVQPGGVRQFAVQGYGANESNGIECAARGLAEGMVRGLKP